MSEHTPQRFDNEKSGHETRKVAEHLHFRENEAMSALRNAIADIPDYETAQAFFIQYRKLAEQEADTLPAPQRLLALVGIPIGMAALYRENQRFIELFEHIESELADALLFADNIPSELMSPQLLDSIENL